uniref:Uncharacterized protein n=1 Tax=Glossina palpalis gambiensis TaxID=67801 RepID=A0A1B0BIP7_9MUSC
MAVPFYLPEGGADDTVASAAGLASDGTGSTSSSSQSSPNTTSSATQTPIQSPLVPGDLVMAFCEAFYRYSINSALKEHDFTTTGGLEYQMAIRHSVTVPFSICFCYFCNVVFTVSA